MSRLVVVRGINFPSGVCDASGRRLETRLEPGTEVTEEHRNAMGPRALADYLGCGAVEEEAVVVVQSPPATPDEGEKE